MERIIAGIAIKVNDEGFLTDHHDWTPEVAKEIANEEGIALTDHHWKVIDFIQAQHKNQVPLTIRKVGKSGVVDIKQFYGLFPGGPLKKASRISGIPKPVSCI